ncbi:MAG: hypothetical protein D6696_12250 [Acidobacteria bacterium]|nr:MAG: hypothetical protein D6696_12250 [Acidobacteriota bacterium]
MSRIGRRRRRLRRAALLLEAAVVLALIGAVAGYLASRPEVRRPGEPLEEITSKLSAEVPPSAPPPHWRDVTAEAGLDGFVTFRGARTSQLPEDMGAGAAWGDADNDGDDDLFLVAAGGPVDAPPESWAPSRLYENRGDGTFRPVAEFPDLRIIGMAAAWGDADGDGWLDLVVSGYKTLRLYRNRRGRLEPDPSFTAPEGYWAGVAWGDFDRDRDLDLYVCGYVRYLPPSGERRMSQQYGAAVPFTLNPASYEPERNLLLRNDGPDGEGGIAFTEVAALYGVSNPEGRSLSALWHDFDDDGWLDLYVANDISDNALYLNRGGETFDDAGLAAWVADYRGAMGLAAGDVDRDGDDDLFVSHWVAQENALYSSRLREMAAAGGVAASRLTFSDVAAPLGLGQIALPMVGWGAELADLDADGWLDLVVANGSTFETDDDPPRLKPQPAFLFWNEAGRRFHDLAPASPPFATPRVGRGLALSDYDRDGDLDLLLVDLGGGAVLLANDMQRGNWLEVRLRSRTASGEPHGFGDGARLVAEAGGAVLRRTVGGASYLSQSSRTVHFGLGPAERVDHLRVRWPGGEEQLFDRLEANAVWELVEGDPEARRVEVVAAGDERARVTAFWQRQRAAMDAMKRDGDCERAIVLFRQALELDPEHEDARYYLGQCLAATGRIDEALAELMILRRRAAHSHRADQQWGVLRAISAASRADLEAARDALLEAQALNAEETGALQALAEVELLLGDEARAEERLHWVCRTNPRAAGAFFLRAYLAWRRGDEAASRALLEAARDARGPDWKPAGAVAEGDVARRMHRERSPLARFYQSWDGGAGDPAQVFAPLARHLAALRS